MAFFTSPIALVMRISRGQASVQLKMVRQRHTPSRSFRMSSRSFAFVSRESKMKRCAFTMAARAHEVLVGPEAGAAGGAGRAQPAG
jgi:hypothetical protein